jgi:hypothetical protein
VTWQKDLEALATGVLKTAVNGAAGSLAREGRKLAKKIDRGLARVVQRAEEPLIEDDDDEVIDPRHP